MYDKTDSKVNGKIIYRDFLKDDDLFNKTINLIFENWVKSCEHFLTNENINRIAWIGQSSACYHCKVSSIYKSGFYLLTDEEQAKANQTALTALIKWLHANDKRDKLIY